MSATVKFTESDDIILPTVFGDDACEHTYGSEWYYNNDKHWHKCTKCGVASTRTAHTYDSDTDEICNVCGQETRHVNHIASSEWRSSSTNHWHKCTKCDQKLDIAAHTFNADNTCTVCEAKAGTVEKDDIKTMYVNGETNGEASWEAGDIATVTKKYFAVSFTMNAAEHAGILADNGTCGLMFGDNDDNCVFIPYDGGNTDTQRTIGINGGVYAVFGKWWGEPDFGTNNWIDISQYVNEDVTILVLGEKNDDGTTTFSAYINGEQVTVWGGDYYATGEFNGRLQWAIRLNGVSATVKFTESDDIILPTVFGDDVCEHTYGSDWYYDDDNHWQKCTQCGSASTRTAHTYDRDTDEICNVCGQKTRHVNHVASSKWTSNAIKHWHKCTECDQKLDIAKHTFNDDYVCTVCGEKSEPIEAGSKNGSMVVTDGVYTVATEGQWSSYVLGASESWEVTMTLNHNVDIAEYGLQICGKDDNGDGLILEGDDSFLQVFLTGNDVIRLIGCDKGWGNVSGYQWECINRYTGLGNKDELTLTVKLDGNNLSYWVGREQLGETIVLDDNVIYGKVVTLVMKHTDTSISNVTYIDRTIDTHEHTYGSTWYYNADKHWQKCTQCGSTTDPTAHTYDSATDEICNVCGQETRHVNHIASSEWKSNATSHWHKCTECDQKLDTAEHTFNDNNVCTVCGAKKATVEKDDIKTIYADGGEPGENKTGDVATVTKKYFAVSYTMMASTYAGHPTDNGCCGLFFGDDDSTCVLIPYDGGTTDTQRILGIWDGNYLVFGNWWGQPIIFNGTAAAEITADTEVTILVLGVKNDDGTTTVTAYLNGTQINVWGKELEATGNFNGHIGWQTKLSGQEATVKFTESDDIILPTVFDIKDDEPTTKQIFTYTVNDDGRSCMITGLVDETLTEVTIPSTIDGYKVTIIGYEAFYECTNLTSITIPNGVTNIGDSAFRYCTSLTSVTIPDSLTSIGSEVFFGCLSLEKVNYIGDIESWLKISFSWASNPCCNGAKLYLGSILVTEVEIPGTVTKIGDYAFRGCTSLTSITIPDSVTSIGSDAFSECMNLKNVYYIGDIESWLKISFDTWASNPCCNGAELYFDGTLVTEVEIPGTVTKIGSHAFSGCTSLISLTIPDGVTNIVDYEFRDCTNLISITIPDSLTSIGSDAFYNCASLKKVYYIGDVESWLKISFNDWYSNPCCNGAELYFNGTLVTEVEIPGTVTKIGNYAFRGCTSLKSITISDSVKSICDRAFERCLSLTSVIIGNGVRSIDEGAFENCTRLTSITIPDGLTSIGNWAFSWCTSLQKVYYNGDAESWLKISFGTADSNPCHNGAELYFNEELVTEVEIPDTVTNIGNYAFRGCTSLTSITIPNSVTSIGGNAFENCTSLTSIIIPDSVTNIYWYAFSGCTSLESVIIGNGLTSIDIFAFSWCTSLTSVIIGNGVMSIGSEVFYNCTSLTSVTIGDGVTSIGSEVFYNCTSLESITIPSNVTSIGYGAFSDCTSLEKIYYEGTADGWSSISIGNYNDYLTSAARYYFSETKPTEEGNWWHYVDGVPTVWDVNFTYTVNSDGTSCTITGLVDETLTEVTIPSTIDGYEVTRIGNWAFYDCTSLASIAIPDSVTSIGDRAFRYCTSLTSITIPDSVTSIGYGAFMDCTSLTSITIPDSVTSIGGDAFMDCTSLTSITIPDSVTSIGGDAFYNCTSLASITIPDSVTSIGESAFSGCTSLTSVAIPDSVTSIGEWAFNHCTNLTSITIGNGVTNIGFHAFYCCTSLTSITIPDSVTSIGDYAFEYCTSLTRVAIPESVTSIGNYAFEYCTSLTSIIIPDSVTSIGGDVFYNCTSLEKVYYKGTADEWSKISIRSDNDCLTDASRYYYSETEPTESGNWWHYVDGVPTVWDVEDEPTTKQIFTYTVNDDGTSCTITGLVDKTLTEVTIPSTIDGYTVTSIGEGAFRDCTSLTKVTIPDSVTSIGDYAFYGCTNLSETNFVNSPSVQLFYLMHPRAVTESAGLKHIGKSAFGGCVKLVFIDIPAELETLGDEAFSGCTSLEAAIVPNCTEHCGTGIFAGCESLTEVGIADGAEISEGMFKDCTSLETVELPESLTSVGTGAFEGCTSLETIELPKSVETVESGAFKGCTSLESIELPENLTSIGTSAFEGCTALETIEIPESVESVEPGAFNGCASLETITVKGSNTEIKGDASTIPENSKIHCAPDAKVLDYVSQNVRETVIAEHEHSGGELTCDNDRHWRICAECLAPYDVSTHIYDNDEDTDCNVCGCTRTLYGDANGDGKINSADIILIKKYIANYDPKTNQSLVDVSVGADANADGTINSKDIILLKKYIANYDGKTGTSSVILGKT